MNYKQLCEEIKRLQHVISTSNNKFLINDYTKNLKKLLREKKDYERFTGIKYPPYVLKNSDKHYKRGIF